MKLFALLIGINEYSPASKSAVRSLQACLNDVANIKAFLKAHYVDLITDEGQILTLTNEQATRRNVINGFKNHLTQAKKGDVALVYYSGHGSTGITAPEFQKLTTDGQEQTWVLHDSREVGKYDLADKEIALLLEEAGRNHPHLVVIADSCHSGSITRDVAEFQQMQPRFTSGIKEPRPLETYLNGAYTQRADLVIPFTNHLLMAACERTEVALEADGQGQFTKSLLTVLNKNGGQIQYSDLFVQVRAAIKSWVEHQTPQLETLGDFSARQGFLGRKVSQGILSRYRVHFENGKWLLDVGAGMGIEQNMLSQNPEIHIFDSVAEGEKIGKATLTAINITVSTLEILEGELDESAVYWGEPVRLLMEPFFVYADKQVQELLKDTFATMTESGIFLSDEANACRFRITNENDTLFIEDIKANVKVQGVKGVSEASIKKLVELLQHPVRWHRLLELKNVTSEIDESAIEFIIKVNQQYDCPEAVVTLEYDNKPIHFDAFFANNTDQDLYVTLLHQSRNYGIRVLKNDTKPIGAGESLTLVKDTFTLSQANNEEIDTLKLLISTDFIDSALLSQKDLVLGKIIKADSVDKGLGSARGIGEAETVKSDWLTKTTTIRVVRKGKQVAGAEPLKIGKGIEIQTHSSFRGNINWAPLLPKTRSVSELAIQNAYFVTNPYCRIVNFSEQSKSTESTEDKSILEIGDIQQKEKLKEEPLVVTVQPQETDELVLPMFFDGEDFLPLGKATVDESGSLRFEITQIPDEKGETKTRSLGSALRMVFVKFANKLGLKGETHQLRWVDYHDDDEAVRTSDGLKEKVAEAKKVLLLIHGIIGDTEEMAETFRMAAGKGYDLVLTYDYENLNTPIEENGLILKNKLEATGFGKDDGKELVLVVHSMGGLVARYMVERLGGEAFVDKLIMAGTPNGGSAFGNAPDYLNWASITLGIGAKLFPPQAGAVAAFASGILKGFSKTLLPSLGQMKVGSPFIVDLAAGLPPKIPYQVIGGDLDAYLSDKDSLPLMEKAVAQLGEWVYKNVKNDIAVSMDNIFNVRNTPAKEVPCHHLNYFITPASVKELSEAIG